MPRRGRRPAGGSRGVARAGGSGRSSPGGSAAVQDTIVPVGPCVEGAPTQRWSDAPALPVAHARDVVACVAAAVAALVLAAGGPAAADPSDQPGGTSGVLDSRALDELQQRAAEVQAGLQAQQGEVTAARDALDAGASRPSPTPQKVVDDAEGELAGYQEVVAGYASALYRDGGGADAAHACCSPAATPATCWRRWASWTSSTRTPPR